MFIVEMSVDDADPEGGRMFFEKLLNQRNDTSK